MAAFLIWVSLLNGHVPMLPLPEGRPRPVAVHPAYVHPVRPRLLH